LHGSYHSKRNAETCNETIEKEENTSRAPVHLFPIHATESCDENKSIERKSQKTVSTVQTKTRSQKWWHGRWDSMVVDENDVSQTDTKFGIEKTWYGPLKEADFRNWVMQQEDCIIFTTTKPKSKPRYGISLTPDEPFKTKLATFFLIQKMNEIRANLH